MSNWKYAEKVVAKFLSGKRNLRGRDFSESNSDVDSDIFTAEVKCHKNYSPVIDFYAENCGKNGKIDILLVNERWILCKHKFFFCVFEDLIIGRFGDENYNIIEKKRKRLFFLEDYQQSFRYSQKKNLFPLLIYKLPKRKDFFIIFDRKWHGLIYAGRKRNRRTIRRL